MAFPNSESRCRGNHGASKSGIPKRKKTSTRTQLSCKIEYLLRPNQPDGSSISEFFTGDGAARHVRHDARCVTSRLNKVRAKVVKCRERAERFKLRERSGSEDFEIKVRRIDVSLSHRLSDALERWDSIDRVQF